MRFDAIQLFTGEFEKMKVFYIETLGLGLTYENQQEFAVNVGRTELSFRRDDTGQNPFYHFAINIPRNKMREAKDWTVSRVNLNEEDGRDEVFFKSWNAEAIYFEDPSGNIVEFIARHNLQNETAGPFTASDFLNISEIGIVTKDVASVAHTMNQLGIPNWRDGGEGFAPVGDEEGLFIIVNNKRRWYFSERWAGMYSLAVKVQGLGSIELAENGSLLINGV